MASEIAIRVAARYMHAFKYGPKETKQHRVEKLTDTIRDATGLGRGMAEAIADAIVRGRDWLDLRFPKNWPIDDAGVLEGPKGSLDLAQLSLIKTAGWWKIKDVETGQIDWVHPSATSPAGKGTGKMVNVVEPTGELVNGDGPADVMGPTVDKIIAMYQESFSRKPTKRELHAVLNFVSNPLGLEP